MADVWTIKSLLSWTDTYFLDRGIDSPRLTAEVLLADVLGLRRLDLYLQHDRPLEKQELADFKCLIQRRTAKEPVAYIIGRKGFFKEQFKVGSGTLIPRPDTEVLVETAEAWLADFRAENRQARVIELGVGSGAVIISLANLYPQHLYFGCDLSGDALAMTSVNAKELAETSIALFKSNWLSAVAYRAQFDLILSNPPYIPSTEIESLAPEIRDHEPRMALDGGKDGLDAVRIILFQAGDRLFPRGQLMVEIGHDQKTAVAALAKRFTWVSDVMFVKDLAGHHRVAVFKK